MEPPREIVIVEDDRDWARTLTLFLENEGFRVRTACDGREGRRIIEENPPDLIILDVMMTTDTEGFDLANRLKRNPRYSGIPILMLTGFLSVMMEDAPAPFHQVLLEDWPVSELLEKPVSPEKVVESVKQLLV